MAVAQLDSREQITPAVCRQFQTEEAVEEAWLAFAGVVIVRGKHDVATGFAGTEYDVKAERHALR